MTALDDSLFVHFSVMCVTCQLLFSTLTRILHADSSLQPRLRIFTPIIISGVRPDEA